jgi:two-component system nitrogen regulation response regulator NtrX
VAERVLVVDDEPGVRAAVEAILGDEGFEVSTAASGEEGLDRALSGTFDVILLDVWLPGMDGLETLVRIRERELDTAVVMISGHGTIETAVRATKLGAFDFIEKPLSLEKTLLVVRNALRQRQLERRTRRLLEQLDRDTEILGSSAAARRLRAQVATAASSDAPVLVAGEWGSGRQTVARRIHATSSRAERAFVVVPCAALEASAAAEALFGGPGMPDRVRLASGGTLFLEDVDRLDRAVQVRLAAAVGSRDGPFREVRLVASATSPPVALEPSLKGELDVLRVELPPLRERREDIPAFAERFMRDLSREYGKPPKRLSPEAISALTAYPWPGNVAELRNLVERLLLLTASETVRLEDLPAEMGGRVHASENLYREFSSLAEGLEAFERYAIRRALATEGHDLEAAARRLGLDPRELASRARRLGVIS